MENDKKKLFWNLVCLSDKPQPRKYILSQMKAKFVISDREMRNLKNELLRERYPFGSSQKGYFRIKTETEKNEAISALRAQAMDELETARLIENIDLEKKQGRLL